MSRPETSAQERVRALAMANANASKPPLTGAQIAALIAGGTLAAVWLITSWQSTPDHVGEARRACIGAIMATLHDPSSSDFSDPSVIKTADKGYHVSFTVRAKNGFGAVRAGYATCQIGADGRVKSVSGP